MVNIYLASADQHSKFILPLIRKLGYCYYNLFSFYYLSNKTLLKNYLELTDYSINTLVDSGAHSFQKGTKVNFNQFLKDYGKFIQQTDNPKCLGYFELDIDNIVGYDKVLEYRQYLENITDKIIPVWHPNRGIKDFKQMCNDYNYVSISGWANEDIHDKDFHLFVNYAHKKGCKIHGLGLTRIKVLNKVNFDTVDSSSWTAPLRFRTIDKKYISKKYANNKRKQFEQLCYLKGMQQQKQYMRIK